MLSDNTNTNGMDDYKATEDRPEMLEYKTVGKVLVFNLFFFVLYILFLMLCQGYYYGFNSIVKYKLLGILLFIYEGMTYIYIYRKRWFE